MSTLDILLLAFFGYEVYRGSKVGFIRSILTLIGFWIGIILGVTISRLYAPTLGAVFLNFLVTTLLLLGFSAAGGLIGRAIGRKLSRHNEALNLKRIDGFFGGAFSGALSLFLAWLLLSIVYGGPVTTINRQIQQSAVIHAADSIMPPVPILFGRISQLISPNGLLNIFIGSEIPSSSVSEANQNDISSAIKNAGYATVKIEGSGCGGLIFGSGFVVTNDLIITNAHVVAGIRNPVVSKGGSSWRAATVLFEPKADIAILRVSGLNINPLIIDESVLDRGTHTIALGYPGGGDLTASPSGIRRRITSLGRDIYRQEFSERDIYELQSDIAEGNSGGPLVLPDGSVVGVVFAKSLSFTNVGYAITSSRLNEYIAQAQSSRNVSTQTCVYE